MGMSVPSVQGSMFKVQGENPVSPAYYVQRTSLKAECSPSVIPAWNAGIQVTRM